MLFRTSCHPPLMPDAALSGGHQSWMLGQCIICLQLVTMLFKTHFKWNLSLTIPIVG